MKTEYITFNLKEIIDYFTKGFEDKDGKKLDITKYEYFLDANKGKVIFELYINDKKYGKK